MIHRERLRAWKSQAIDVLALAANTSRNVELIEKVGVACDELLGMVLHQPGSYTLTAKPDPPKTPEPSDLELLNMLDSKLKDG